MMPSVGTINTPVLSVQVSYPRPCPRCENPPSTSCHHERGIWCNASTSRGETSPSHRSLSLEAFVKPEIRWTCQKWQGYLWTCRWGFSPRAHRTLDMNTTVAPFPLISKNTQRRPMKPVIALSSKFENGQVSGFYITKCTVAILTEINRLTSICETNLSERIPRPLF